MHRSVLTSGLLIFFLSYLGFAAYLYFNQRAYLYFPTPDPGDSRGGRFTLEHDDTRLRIWHLQPGKSVAIIYFGGNAEAVEWNVPVFNRLFPGKTVYLPHYRGFGGSTGQPSEEGLFKDAVALYDHIASQHEEVWVVGRSLGSGIATYLASQRPVKRMVLVTPYDSMVALARREYPFFPVSWMLKDRYDSLAHVPRIDAETLIIIAVQDQVIPEAHSRRLAEAFPDEIVQVQELEDADHFNVDNHPGYLKYLKEFFSP